MTDPVLRDTVGVRNPFALAEAKLGKEIDWRNTSVTQKKELIERALGASYREIFDPKNTNPALIHPVKSGSGDPTQCDTAVINSLISGWGRSPLGNTYCYPVGGYGAYNDPVQGSLSDCYFMAALASIAFASSTKQQFFYDRGGSSFDLTFWDGFVTTDGVTAPQRSTTVTINNNHFPLGQNGKLVFARSNTPVEIWPAVYEKGFAEWKCGGSPSEPDYSKCCQGNPIAALSTITGYKFSTTSYFATRSFATNPSAIYDKIAGACNIAPPTHPNDRATYWPVIAFTYDSALLGYSNATIVRNHSYSVLGVQKTATDQFIVLRNPWGQVPPPVILDPALLDQYRCINDEQGNPIMCFGDPNLGPDVLSTNSWLGISDLSSPDDGIFGLNVKAFQQYFQGFGWVFA
jgi:hypothetical protein